MCIDIFTDIENNKVTTNYSSNGNKKKRPFSYNNLINLFEPRP